jgi:cytochrome P450
MLFNSSEAYNSVFGYNTNVRKWDFYEVWNRNAGDLNTLNCTNIVLHARRRKALALAFTDQSVKPTIPFMERHVDRGNELLSGKKFDSEGWSNPQDLSSWADYLMFDLFGDICFGKANNTKEPESNTLKEIPHAIASYMCLYNPVRFIPARPFTEYTNDAATDRQIASAGCDALVETPRVGCGYGSYSPKGRQGVLRLLRSFSSGPHRQRATTRSEKGSVEREDMFDFLCTVKDPETGHFALTTEELIADSNLLIIAGSDTTSSTTTALFFFFITRNPQVYAKLVRESTTNFKSAEDIGSGPDLMTKCEYLRTVIYETLRLSPAGPSEEERTILPGGATIARDFYPEGVDVGIPTWSIGRNENLFKDVNVFRPERWIISDNPDTLNT